MDADTWSQFWERQVATIPGWLNPWEGYTLHRLASNVGQGQCAEIGCYQGRSTLCLASGLIRRAPSGKAAILHSIDLFEDAYTFQDCPLPRSSVPLLRAHLQDGGVADLVRIHFGDSRDLSVVAQVPDALELLFVDGDHEYDSLVSEWKLWNTKLIVGATVAYHDYGNAQVGDGVRRFCDQIAHLFRHVEVCDRYLREPGSIPGGLFIGYGYLESQYSEVCEAS